MNDEMDFDDDDIDAYIVQDDSRPNTLTADALSLLNELFESNKREDRISKSFIVDLKSLYESLQQQVQNLQKPKVPLEVFEIFFGDYMKRKAVITQQDFADMIETAENRLFEIGNETNSVSTED